MSQDRVDIAAQRKAESARAETARQRALQDVNDMVWLMRQRPGRRIMYGLLEKAGVYQEVFTGNSETFFRAGKRAVGLAYLDILNRHVIEDMIKMLMEAKEDHEQGL